MIDGKKAILFAEDDSILRKVFGSMLRRDFPDCKVVFVSDGQEALDELERRPEGTFDLVISDGIMPNVCGARLFAKLQACAVKKHIPFCFVSGTPKVVVERLEGFGQNTDNISIIDCDIPDEVVAQLDETSIPLLKKPPRRPVLCSVVTRKLKMSSGIEALAVDS